MEECRRLQQAASAEAAAAKAESVATRQEADERQKRFMALNGGWKRKEEALSAATAAAEQAAAEARAAAADALARAEAAAQVCVCFKTARLGLQGAVLAQQSVIRWDHFAIR